MRATTATVWMVYAALAGVVVSATALAFDIRRTRSSCHRHLAEALEEIQRLREIVERWWL